MNKNFKKFISTAIAAIMAISAISVHSVFAENEGNAENPFSEMLDYTGGEVMPELQLFSAGVRLEKGIDYDLSYENNVNVGTATAIVNFKGNYSGERRVNFEIVAKALTGSDVVFSTIDNQTYTGSAVTPKPTVSFGDVTLVEGTDYDVSYTNNTNVGTATINVSFKGNYSGTASTTFEIVADALSTEKIVFSAIDTQTYTGSALVPEPTVTYGDVTLVKDRDYTLSYENNVNVGTATVNVSFKGNYSGTAATNFEITAKAVTEENISVSEIPNQTYTGSAITPEPMIIDVSR